MSEVKPEIDMERALAKAKEIVAYDPIIDAWQEIKLSETMLLAEALIARMEPVRVVWKGVNRNTRCPGCAYPVVPAFNYCHKCGKCLLWTN